MGYKHLFFDLDHTLWDFDANSKKALNLMYYEFDFRQFGMLSPDHFIDTYEPINRKAWSDYTDGLIDTYTVKTKRFADTIAKFGIVNNELVQQLNQFYMQQLPLSGIVMKNTFEMLAKVKPHFKVHLVTNGFKEVTYEKLKHSKLENQFESVLTAEEVGVLKPNPKVFLTALENNNATAEESLFIGDNLKADVRGAKGVGMDQVFFNPHRQNHNHRPTYEINDLIEMLPILGLK